jgi:hypothetical protein
MGLGMGRPGVSVYFWPCISETVDGILIKFAVIDREFKWAN